MIASLTGGDRPRTKVEMATAETQEQNWQCDKSLVECLKYLFTSGIACDVTFLVGEDRCRISAHKTILISRSPVFYAMFEGNLAEKGEIVIPDIKQEVFTMFLRYLYTDEITLTANIATPILSAARKYMVDRLVTKCETFLERCLTADNVCLLIEQAHIYTEENLKEKCINLIHVSNSPEQILKSSCFVDLCGACVTSIIESDDLAVEEILLYEAVIRWSDAECERQDLEVTDANRRKVLGDILYTVRFPLLDLKYLLERVITRDILTGDEIRSILRVQQDKEAFPCTQFNQNQRKPVKRAIECIRRFTGTEKSRLPFNDDSDYISFVSTVDMSLCGLQLYGSCNGNQNIQIGVYNQHGDSLYKEMHVLTTNEECTIEFENVIPITRDHMYTVVLHGGVHTKVYGTGGRSTVTFRNGQVRFMESSCFPSAKTNLQEGQIPGLLVYL